MVSSNRYTKLEASCFYNKGRDREVQPVTSRLGNRSYKLPIGNSYWYISKLLTGETFTLILTFSLQGRNEQRYKRKAKLKVHTTSLIYLQQGPRTRDLVPELPPHLSSPSGGEGREVQRLRD